MILPDADVENYNGNVDKDLTGKDNELMDESKDSGEDNSVLIEEKIEDDEENVDTLQHQNQGISVQSYGDKSYGENPGILAGDNGGSVDEKCHGKEHEEIPDKSHDKTEENVDTKSIDDS